MPTDDAIKKAISTLILDSRYKKNYLLKIRGKYSLRDFYLGIIIAVGTNATVASFTLWKQFPDVWNVIGWIVALVTIVHPLLKYSDKMGTISDLVTEWTSIEHEAEKMEIKALTGGTVTSDEFLVLLSKAHALEDKEVKIPNIPKLGIEVQSQIMKGTPRLVSQEAIPQTNRNVNPQEDRLKGRIVPPNPWPD